jgi:hypothetical protein
LPELQSPEVPLCEQKPDRQSPNEDPWKLLILLEERPFLRLGLEAAPDKSDQWRTFVADVYRRQTRVSPAAKP